MPHSSYQNSSYQIRIHAQVERDNLTITVRSYNEAQAGALAEFLKDQTVGWLRNRTPP